MRKRFNILAIFIMIAFSVIIYKLTIVQLIDNDYYADYVFRNSRNIFYGDSTPRGKIYDRNGVVLVDNESVKTINYVKSPSSSVSSEIELAYTLSRNIEFNYTYLSDYNLKKFYLLLRGNYYDYDKMIDTVLDNDLSVLEEIDKEAAYVYYLMNNGYYYMPKALKKDISDSEYNYIVSSNLEGISINLDWKRKYNYDAFRSILGNVSSIPYESKDYYLDNGYSLNDRVGVTYLENVYEEYLKGVKTKYEVKDGKLIVLEQGYKGNDIYLTIDIELQVFLEELLEEELFKTKKEYNTKYFDKLYVVVTDPNTGDILAMSGKKIVSVNGEYKIYDYTPGVLTNAYASGSVVKGASQIVGYNTGALKIGEVRDDSCLKIGTVNKCSWKYLGSINDITALKLSSNTYQFHTAIKVGGGKYVYGKNINLNEKAFDIYRDTFKEFGLGVKTGIDLVGEATGYKGTSTLPGLLLDFSIGQYDTYTPLQLAQYISALSIGDRMKLRLVSGIGLRDGSVEKIEPVLLNSINTEEKYLDRVHLGFKEVVSSGLGYGYMYYRGSGKTGTSETFLDSDGNGVIDTETITKTFVGYFPYDNPKFAFSVVAPDISYGSGYESNVTSRVSYKLTKMIYELYKDEL